MRQRIRYATRLAAGLHAVNLKGPHYSVAGMRHPIQRCFQGEVPTFPESKHEGNTPRSSDTSPDSQHNSWLRRMCEGNWTYTTEVIQTWVSVRCSSGRLKSSPQRKLAIWHIKDWKAGKHLPVRASTGILTAPAASQAADVRVPKYIPWPHSRPLDSTAPTVKSLIETDRHGKSVRSKC